MNAHQQVDRLLHDAERAEAGAAFARALGDLAAAGRLLTKARGLRDEAERIDPAHAAEAWLLIDEEPPF